MINKETTYFLIIPYYIILYYEHAWYIIILFRCTEYMYLKRMHESNIVDFSKFNTENNNDNKGLQKVI